MPCFTRWNISTEVNINNVELFKAALKDKGVNVIERADGSVTFYGTLDGKEVNGVLKPHLKKIDFSGIQGQSAEDMEKTVTGTYNRYAVAVTAKKFGWLTKSAGPNKLKLFKR